MTYPTLIVLPGHNTTQRHRERGLKGSDEPPFKQDLIIASYLGSLNTKPFQV